MQQPFIKLLIILPIYIIQKTDLLFCLDRGEDFSERLDDVKKSLMTYMFIFFIVGIGTEKGAPIPLYDADGRGAGI